MSIQGRSKTDTRQMPDWSRTRGSRSEEAGWSLRAAWSESHTLSSRLHPFETVQEQTRPKALQHGNKGNLWTTTSSIPWVSLDPLGLASHHSHLCIRPENIPATRPLSRTTASAADPGTDSYSCKHRSSSDLYEGGRYGIHRRYRRAIAGRRRRNRTV